MVKTQSVVFVSPGEVAVEDVSLRPPDSGEVHLRAHTTLISPGTERAFLLGLPNTSQEYPQRPGYNFTGEVVALGEGVEELTIGQRVVAAARHACDVVIAASQVVPVPDGVAHEQAVFFNMLGIALQGVRRSRLELGESVVIMGQGQVGLLAMMLSRIAGAVPVVALDPDARRRGVSEKVGVDRVLDSSDKAAVRDLLADLGGGADVVIEATGAPQPIPTAFHLARRGGRVVLLASTRGETESVNFYREVHKKGLTLYGAHNSARPSADSQPSVWTWRRDAVAVLELMAHSRLDMTPLISHRFTATDATSAYALLADWDPSIVGVILDWS
ncbi:MAG: zinc-binding alcohol dehydrogenase [Candidatus Latescibacterota bacterium]|nr:zinc-binding alcohol dehydrogenase [Candidatus Latescibacterota bacterium]